MVKYIISLGKNSSLSLKVLSMKLVTLFALTCPERISTLANLDLRHYYVHPEGVSFQLTIPRKTGSAYKPAEAFFARFNQDKKLCPVECFRHYLKLTRNIRPVIPSSLPDKLFISFKRPFKPVTTTTLGRWLRTFMSAAGIDCQISKLTQYAAPLRQQPPRHLFHCQLSCLWLTGLPLQRSEIFIISPCITQTLLSEF